LLHAGKGQQGQASTPSKPNIMFIMADNIGLMNPPAARGIMAAAQFVNWFRGKPDRTNLSFNCP